MALKDLSAEEMPREKLLLHGPQVLSDAELIAILLRTGVHGENVLDYSKRFLKENGNLEGLARMTTSELMQMKGMKNAKAATLSAALEFGRRLATLQLKTLPIWKREAHRIAIETKYESREIIYALYLDSKERVIDTQTLSYGGLSGAFLDLPVFFRNAVKISAAKVVLIHNHPDGTKKASNDDMTLTNYVERGLRILAIELKGHYIAANGELYSIKGKDIKSN